MYRSCVILNVFLASSTSAHTAYLVPWSASAEAVRLSMPVDSSKKDAGWVVSTRVIEFALISPERYWIYFFVSLI